MKVCVFVVLQLEPRVCDVVSHNFITHKHTHTYLFIAGAKGEPCQGGLLVVSIYFNLFPGTGEEAQGQQEKETRLVGG